MSRRRLLFILVLFLRETGANDERAGFYPACDERRIQVLCLDSSGFAAEAPYNWPQLAGPAFLLEND